MTYKSSSTDRKPYVSKMGLITTQIAYGNYRGELDPAMATAVLHELDLTMRAVESAWQSYQRRYPLDTRGQLDIFGQPEAIGHLIPGTSRRV